MAATATPRRRSSRPSRGRRSGPASWVTSAAANADPAIQPEAGRRQAVALLELGQQGEHRADPGHRERRDDVEPPHDVELQLRRSFCPSRSAESGRSEGQTGVTWCRTGRRRVRPCGRDALGDQGPVQRVVAVHDVVVGGGEVGDDDEVEVALVDPQVGAEA